MDIACGQYTLVFVGPRHLAGRTITASPCPDRSPQWSLTIIGQEDFGDAIKSKLACATTTVSVLRNDGVTLFGRNDYGQLGLGDDTDRCEPCVIEALWTSSSSASPAAAPFNGACCVTCTRSTQ